jgi:hypothetical protein
MVRTDGPRGGFGQIGDVMLLERTESVYEAALKFRQRPLAEGVEDEQNRNELAQLLDVRCQLRRVKAGEQRIRAYRIAGVVARDVAHQDRPMAARK